MNLLKKYFDGEFSPGLLSLYGSRAIMLVASGFLGIFFPIFLFELFGSDIKLVALYYGLTSLLYLLIVPFGAMFLNGFGFRNSLRLSVLWGVIFYIISYLLGPENINFLIPSSIIVLVLWRVFYWLPYHVDFAKFTSDEDRGRQLSLFSVTGNITAGLIPILSGFLIVKYGFDFVFIIAIILYLLSGLFYMKLPHTKEKFDWSYSRSWSEFLSKKNRQTNLAFMADGAEGVVGTIIWPVFIFQLLDGNYFEVGFVSAFIIVITIALQLLLGRSLDKKKNKKHILKLGTFLYSLGWIIKIFIFTAFHIFVVGVYHNLVKIFARTSFDVLTYDIAADQNHYVDEFTVIHEMSVHTGKVIVVAFIIVLSLFLPLQWTFLLAAISSVIMNILTDKDRELFKA